MGCRVAGSECAVTRPRRTCENQDGLLALRRHDIHDLLESRFMKYTLFYP